MAQSEERQIIGMLADKDDINGKDKDKDSIFINRSSAIQYVVKSLMFPKEDAELFTGYMSSFEDELDFEDDEYLDNAERIDRFKSWINDWLFVFSYKVNGDGEYKKIKKVSLVPAPSSVSKNSEFYSIPVFSAADDEIIQRWSDTKRYQLWRDYNSLKDFKENIRTKKPVGSLYGYDLDEFKPSFVIWRDTDGKLFAIGGITDIGYNSLRGVILEGTDIAKIDISEYLNFVVYDINTNPTVAFLPVSLYKDIEDRILKDAEEHNVNESSIELTEEIIESTVEKNDMVNSFEEEVTDVREIVEHSNIVLQEIDASEKSDELIIKAMDYHSQKNNLFYSMKDLVNVHTAIKCSNLVILSGLSGTGKSKLVEMYAKALGINQSNNPDEKRLLIIPVRPSWNDDADLLGYLDLVHMVYRASDTGFVDLLVNAQKDANKNKIYIVCFDEMNLARVEHYFSQFLSILEREPNQRELQLYDDQYTGRLYNSKDYPSRIKIGDNIRFIGTVNVDESTYHFSDKVLDRANVIQLNVLNYADEWKTKPYANLSSINWTKDDYNKLIRKNSENNSKMLHQLLWDIHQLMQSASAKYGVGPRIVKAIENYIYNLPQKEIDGFNEKIALDYQIVQRVLTKVRGPESQLGYILKRESDNNFYKIFEEYSELSEFENCIKVIEQKQKELEAYGYCIQFAIYVKINKELSKYFDARSYAI